MIPNISKVPVQALPTCMGTFKQLYRPIDPQIGAKLQLTVFNIELAVAMTFFAFPIEPDFICLILILLFYYILCHYRCNKTINIITFIIIIKFILIIISNKINNSSIFLINNITLLILFLY